MTVKAKKYENCDIGFVSEGSVSIEHMHFYGSDRIDAEKALNEVQRFHYNSDDETKLCLKVYSEKVHGNSFFKGLSPDAIRDVWAFKNILNAMTESKNKALEEVGRYRSLNDSLKSGRCFFCRLFSKKTFEALE